MIDENLETRLSAWCDKVSTTYSNVFYIINDRIVIKRYDGYGVSGILHSFNSSVDLEKFLNKSEKLLVKLKKSHEKFEKESGLGGMLNE